MIAVTRIATGVAAGGMGSEAARAITASPARRGVEGMKAAATKTASGMKASATTTATPTATEAAAPATMEAAASATARLG